MSQENVEVARQSVALAADSRRRLEERLILRFPFIQGLIARLWWKLSPRSRLRRAILRRLLRSGFEAANRQDYDVTFALYHPDGETILPEEFVALGFEPVVRGREARRALQERWNAEWGDFRFEAEEVIDLGDGRFLVIARMLVSGLSSGAPIDSDWAALFTLSAGLAIREQIFVDRRKALEAVGLRE
jgi:ketosteroid isomerase-like protein